MKFRIEPFTAWHLAHLAQAEAAEGGQSLVSLSPELIPLLEQQNSWSLIRGEDDVIACGGTLQQWPHRHHAWLYFTQRTGRYMVRLYRLAQHFLEPVEGRIEATVVAGFEPGHRFIQLLGFEVENPPGLLRAFDPDKRDHISYVRFQ